MEFEHEHELDPTIWSKLPRDVLLNVVEQSDLPTQINWSCTSRAIFLEASSKVWESLHVRGSAITAYVLIVSGFRSTDRADGIVHFLLESAYRHKNKWDHVFASDRTDGMFILRRNGSERYSHPDQLLATLPLSHVKDFGIENQGFKDQHPICKQFDMDLVLPSLLQRLPKLQSFNYVGPLSARMLTTIIQVNSLKVLQVRNGNDVLKAPTSLFAIHTLPWTDVSLDWSALANMKGLEELEVGRLIRHEARRLAEGVISLNLRKLHLSCWGWEYENTLPSTSVPSTASTSALVLFLDALTTLDLGNGQMGPGLPSSLKHVVLVDKFHTRIEVLYQLIATAILPCHNLETLSTTISVNGMCYELLSKMGLPAYHKTIGLGSWQQLSSDEGMKVFHQYRSASGEIFRTNPYPRPLPNIAKTLDRVIEFADGTGIYRMSMNFVRGRQFQSDEILVYPCEGEDGPSAAEQGPQAQDASMMDLAIDFASLSLEETLWAHMLRSWASWLEL